MIWLLRSNPETKSDLWVTSNNHQYIDIRCSIDSEHFHTTRTYVSPTFRLPLDDASDFHFGDALRVAEFGEFLVSGRLASVLVSAGLTGVSTAAAKIMFPNGGENWDYSELRVTALAHIATPAAGCEIEWRCRGCNLREYRPGLRIDLAAAEARPTTDFFVVWPLARYVFCSDRAKALLERFDIPAIRFVDPATLAEPLEFFGDAEIPPYFSPADRARIEAFWAAAPLWP